MQVHGVIDAAHDHWESGRLGGAENGLFLLADPPQFLLSSMDCVK